MVNAFLGALREDLCDPAAELHKRITRASDITASTLVAMLLGALGLSVAAAALVAPLAGAIMALGLRALCAAAEGAH